MPSNSAPPNPAATAPAAPDAPRADLNEPPPLLGTWPRVYAMVLLSQAALVAVFYALTRYYA
ncbi:MAG: hypothetical protein R3F39_24225 [Myxococcota bacterium]